MEFPNDKKRIPILQKVTVHAYLCQLKIFGNNCNCNEFITVYEETIARYYGTNIQLICHIIN